ncbi:two component sensor histidine kinase [Acetobacter aceti NRIC 0242]|uniref:histidine kinase n=2 Tax=Acetobacter aceti TaxID=435 RepID=A0AB33ICE7_ACEAC|nr:HAMP domain-containing sensor histidine kinase [Acetobacter aceti]TCS28336.1 signal transduction histidine kinase [Acetobacter aceti NBRC 14818]BCK75681.1 two-component sensor histidine kinase [Acetobacter aceti NBRC 14818]GAN56260.1 two component sensor histidine kinase [Acetobacter aceti NBRC 14818]GBO81557.1 two component sensor histidine kinase [Acetobacter aceti NRIC 0242]
MGLAFALAMLGTIVVQFSLTYTQMTSFEFRRSGQVLKGEMKLLLAMPPEHLEYVIRERATDDLRLVVNEAGIFTASHQPVAGELRSWPEGLVADGKLHNIVMEPEEGSPYTLRFLAAATPDGHIVVLGRSLHVLDEQKLMLRHASLVTLVPIVFFALLAGTWLSHRALTRVKEMHEAVDLIMQGDIHERLPAGTQQDELQRLAGSVNRMLDRLEQLMRDMRSVGDDIAHDLRTPLARVRVGLERALSGPQALSAETLRGVIERAIGNLDQCFSIITALLRLTEIDNSKGRAAFARIDLTALVYDIVDLYEPIAESEGIEFQTLCPESKISVSGDRDLLIEMLGNLVDNAVKFTPSGGRVRISVSMTGHHPFIAVEDTGIGIQPDERQAVLSRFYRSDKSRHIPGSGLGLSLVASILRLHNAELKILDAQPGLPEKGVCFLVVFPASDYV